MPADMTIVARRDVRTSLLSAARRCSSDPMCMGRHRITAHVGRDLAFSYDLGDFLRSRWRHLNTMAASAPASARPQDRLTRSALRARRSRGYLHLCYAGPPCRATLRAGTFDVGMARREEQSAPQSRRGNSTVRRVWSSTPVTKLQL